MEAQVLEQEQTFQEVQRFIKNYKKDSADRKTLEYLNRKIIRLEDIHDEFINADDVILKEYKDSQPNHKYWVDRASAVTVIQKQLTEMKALRKPLLPITPRLPNPSSNIGSSITGHKSSNDTTSIDACNIQNKHIADGKVDPAQAKRYKTQQLRMRQYHAKVREVITTLDEGQFNVDILKIELEAITSKKEQIEKLHEEIAVEAEENEETTIDYFTEDYFGTVMRRYTDIKSKIVIAIKEAGLSSNCSQNIRSMPKLPQIQIPSFDGNFRNWASFINVFNNLVHDNNSVSDFEKLSYFKDSLKGEPSNLIAHLQLRAENYTIAYNIIHERYENRRKIVSEYIDTILNIPKVHPNSSKDIRTLHDTLRECIEALRNLGYNVEEWSIIFIHLSIKKLDYNSLKHYEESLHGSREFPSMQQFLHLLIERMNVLEALNGASFVQSKPSKVESQRKILVNHQKAKASNNARCNYCEEDGHKITNCVHFKQITPNMRIDFINRSKLCTNCLTHPSKNTCTKIEKCNICNNKHHQLLHTNETFGKERKVSINAMNGNKTTLLSTAKVKLQTSDNKEIILRALIDLGSQVSLITEKACRQLGVQRKKIETSLVGIGGNTKNACSSVVQVQIKPHFSSEFKLQLEAYVLPQITSNIPEQRIIRTSDPRWKNIRLADPEYDHPAPIDILLGADVYAEISETRIIKGNPSAMKTRLGWTIVGPASASESKTLMANISIKEELKQAQELNKFWELEEVPCEKKLTKAEEDCEQMYHQTVKREQTGRYIVALPFKEEKSIMLKSTKQRATQRFLQIEKRLQKDEQLKKLYVEFIKEYLQLGHMKPSSNPYGKFYIPHHAVLKCSAKETKIRVVFDASMKSTAGVSLNDTLHTGPTLQNTLWSLLLRWRKYKIVFSADIVKMYRQIHIAEEHQDYQRILWREEPFHPLQEYNLTTVTYGMSAAPFLAIRTLHQLAEDEGKNFPLANKVLINDFYVDDVLTGADNVQGALNLQAQLIALLDKGEFELSKWSSNHPALLQSINKSNKLVGNLDLAEDETIKTLGIQWNPNSDSFKFGVNQISFETELTKRKLASEVAKLFDPVGWLAPVTIISKLILQQLWTTKLNWDDKVPQEIANSWIKLRNDMSKLESLTIPRWIGKASTANQKIYLHGFCDASEKAYAAVVYSCVELSDGQVISRLLTSKTKVAPTKIQQTLPRLELCGAVLLARLLNEVIKTLELQAVETYTWTDSNIVLAWLQKPASNWKTFIANRVSEIQDTTKIENWRHIMSAQNPADHASRGIFPSKLVTLEQWWNGPDIIKYHVDSNNINKFDTTLDMKKVEVSLQCKAIPPNPIAELINRKSEYLKLLRITAYILRFISKSRRRTSYTEELHASELKTAETTIIKIIQKTEYQYEISRLRDKKDITRKSTITSLNPFLDTNGLLRVGGRLENSDLPFEEKHPIVLPYKSHITSIIINWAHKYTLHGNKALTSAVIRKKYWVVRGSQAVRNHIQRCVICFRFQHKPIEQLMGDLPKGRVTPSRPFTHTGVDYAGPLNIRMSKGRGNKSYKGYISVFICLSTKAVHLEVVSDLTSNSFLAAFKRFTSRRGKVAHMYSDNGTNFVKANKMLLQKHQYWEKSIQDHFSTQGITWHFIPPGAPHFGGLWEAAVKSLKYHLCRVVGDKTLTFEELSTTLCMIEACLNSRPLCPLSNDTGDINILTPGHFLIGNALLAPSEYDLVNKNPNLMTRWELVDHMNQEFWKKWQQEYLSQLQRRSKWKTKYPNIKVGDLVLIKEDNLPPLIWIKGRIKELHPGNDNLVRAATIFTEKGEYKRPITKLCVLPVASDEEPETPSTSRTIQQPAIKRRSPRLQKVQLLLLALTSVFTITLATKGQTPGINMQNLDAPGGIYFDYIGEVERVTAYWTIIIRYDMNRYWSEVYNAEKNLELLRKACLPISTLHCEVIFTQLQLQLHNIKSDNELFTQKRQRHQKRGLGDTIGTLLSDTLGVLSQREAADYEHHFKILEYNDQHLLQLAKNHTSIIDNTIKLLKHSYNLTAIQVQKLQEHQTQLDQDMREQHSKDDQKDLIITATLQLMLMLKNIEDTQQNIIGILHSAQHNNLHRTLLTPTQFESEISHITEHLPPSMAVPGRRLGNLIQLYRSVKTESRVTNNNVVIRVRIPLVNVQSYQIYKLISVPINSDGYQVSITPSSKYFLVDSHREHYAPVSQETFNECLSIHETSLVCRIPQIYSKGAMMSQCEMNMLLRTASIHSSCNIHKSNATNHWIPLHTSNQWIYVTKSEEPSSFDMICESRITPVNLHGSGILSIQPGCLIKDETIQITSVDNKTTNIMESFMATANIKQLETLILNTHRVTQHQPRVNSTTPPTITTLDTSQLEADIQMQKSQEKLNLHHVHHYTMTHVTFWTIIVIVIVGIIIWRRERDNRQPRQPPQPLPRFPDTASVESSSGPPICLVTG